MSRVLCVYRRSDEPTNPGHISTGLHLRLYTNHTKIGKANSGSVGYLEFAYYAGEFWHFAIRLSRKGIIKMIRVWTEGFLVTVENYETRDLQLIKEYAFAVADQIVFNPADRAIVFDEFVEQVSHLLGVSVFDYGELPTDKAISTSSLKALKIDEFVKVAVHRRNGTTFVVPMIDRT